MAKVTVNHIYKIYPGEKGTNVTAVEDVNLEIADREFVMAILEGAEINFLAGSADIGINAEEKVLQTIGICLRMASRIMGVGAGTFAEERRVFHQQLVGFFAIADPHFVRTFLVPDDGAFRAGQFIKQPIFPSGKAL